MIFIISLILCISMHEFGHLVAAKLMGCKVLKYSVGFGKAIWSKTIGGTVYQITPWLLGGFVNLDGETELCDRPNAFCNLPYLKKFAIIVAGCMTNIIVGQIAMLIATYYICAKWALNLYYFGAISLTLGVFNLIPFPALDGSIIILVWLEKFYGKEKGYKILSVLCKVGFAIIMIINIICLPYLIQLLVQGKL